MDRKVEEILSEEQLARVRQAWWRENPPENLMYLDDLLRRLKVTDRQRREMFRVREEQRRLWKELVTAPRRSAQDQEEIDRRIRQWNQDQLGITLSVLTPEQRKAYEEALGPPFIVKKDAIKDER